MGDTDGSDYVLTNKKDLRPLTRHKRYFVAGTATFESGPDLILY